MTKCLKCGRKYRFINKHTQENCDKVIKRRNIISKKSVPCEICGKIMTKPNLRFHMRSWHNPEEAESYNCDQCDYVTKKQARFHLHMNIHGRVTLEPCHICGGKYKRLDWHIKRNHSNDPKNLLVNCEICGKEFQRSHISKHKKNMHMERKFGCHLCSYKAQTKYNLNHRHNLCFQFLYDYRLFDKYNSDPEQAKLDCNRNTLSQHLHNIFLPLTATF